jgi:CubicO group peptidase (beta-lactamase class C family)
MNISFHRCLLAALLILVATSCEDPTDETDSFWSRAQPEDEGIDSAALDSAFDRAGQVNSIHSLLVIRNGRIVGEEYYRGYAIYSYHNIRSVSKSFLSALLGIVLDEGIIDDLDQSILTYFPEYDVNDLPPTMGDVTIRHLITMRAGYAHEETNYSEIFGTEHLLDTILNFGLAYQPGARFSYNTCQTHLLSAILTRASGKTTKALMEEYLLNPLDISPGPWEQDADGIYFGGNNMHFTTRDMAKLGYLYLGDGKIDDRQLVPFNWVRETTTGTLTNSGYWGDLKNWNYGYLWWLGELAGYQSTLAIGHGGQFIIIVPELEMVIAATSNAFVDWDAANTNELAVLDIAANYILPAVNND